MKRIRLSILGLTLVYPVVANAHTADSVGILSGLAHPILGLDHLLAMLSVGILSSQIGGNAIWRIPLAFVAIMVLGGILGIKGEGELPVEFGIASSVIILGGAIALGRRLPMLLCYMFVSVFGLFHGYAHGLEMPSASNPFGYALGFMLSSAGIHIMGILLSLPFTKSQRRRVMLRCAGLAITLTGSALVVSLV